MKDEPESSSSDSDYEPPPQEEDTLDSSSDSSGSTSSDSDVQGPAKRGQARGHQGSKSDQGTTGREPLTFAQLQYVKEGATALRGQPTLESLQKYPHAWKQPVPAIVASRDRPPVAEQLATAMVVADIPPATDEDMPELEDIPPQPQVKHAKKEPE